MKATILHAPYTISCEQAEQPVIEQPTDGILRVVRACVCGSDLWPYRGIDETAEAHKIGHEAIGVIESVGSAVRDFQPGDFVVIPFSYSDGSCPACQRGAQSVCDNLGFYDGCQAEYVRVPYLDGTAYAIERGPLSAEAAARYSDDLLASLTALSDVMGTGYHASQLARVKPGDTVAVVGDGAVGLCAVIGARLHGASRVIALSHHADRAELAKRFGASDIVSSRGNQAVADLLSLTDGIGADAVLECVGNEAAVDIALRITAPLGLVGSVGVPHGVSLAGRQLFERNIGFAAGMAPVRAYLDVLVPAVLQGKIEPGLVFTQTFNLDQVATAYEAMDQRTAIKSLLQVGELV